MKKNNDKGEDTNYLVLPEYNTHKGLVSTRKERDYVMPSFPVKKVGLLVGAGGTGKSIAAIQIAFQVALGRYCDFHLSGIAVKKELSRVLYISLEDESEDIDDRLSFLREFWEHDEEKSILLEDAADFVTFIPLSGLGVTLVDSNCEMTPTFHSVFEKAKEIKSLRLIIVDTLRRAHDAEENSTGEMSQVLRHFEKLAKETGAAVLLLHHENKSGAGDKDAGAGASRGASSIVDNARYVARLQKMTVADAEQRGIDVDTERKQWIRVSLEKTNYGPEQSDAWLKRLNTQSPVLIAQIPPDEKNGKKQSYKEKENLRKTGDTLSTRDIFG